MKKIAMIAVVAFLIVGCGGGSSSSSSPTTQYDMWDYVAAKSNRTSLLDVFTSNSTYTTATSKRQNAGYIEYTISSSNEKIVDYNGQATVTMHLNGNSLTINGTDVGRYKSIGSKLGDCTLEAHHDSFTVATDYTFSDVLEFNCVDYKEFYSKDLGNVINYTKSTLINGNNTTISYGISVVNN